MLRCGDNGSIDRLQVGNNLFALWLEKGRESDLFAQRFHVLVDSETRAIGGDFKEDAVGFAEVEATEIVTIYLAAISDTELVQVLFPFKILRGIGSAEGNVMHSAAPG